ncbi:alpha/beta fold hydrolase [Amycolatopsis thermophila]|uniref:alpha/beta fold hydrolase n=1 Tax=Amycolatopsis thermophila TaxID=206084 RepID=UPI003520D71F
MVLVHGGGADMRSWHHLTSRPPPEAGVFAPDVPGHGTERGFTYRPDVVADLAEHLVDSLERAEIRSPGLVGHSLGGAMP